MNTSYHKSDLKNQIINTTIIMIQQSGYLNVSVRKIATQLNVSSTAIYRHFKNVEDLFQTIILIESENLSEILIKNVDTSNASVEDTMKITARRYVEYAQDNPYMFDLLFLSPYSKKTVDLDTNSPYGTLKTFSELVLYVKDTFGLHESKEILLAQLWSFIFGYAILVREDALDYKEEVVDNLIKKIIVKQG